MTWRILQPSCGPVICLQFPSMEESRFMGPQKYVAYLKRKIWYWFWFREAGPNWRAADPGKGRFVVGRSDEIIPRTSRVKSFAAHSVSVWFSLSSTVTVLFHPLKPNDLQRRRAVTLLKLKSPLNICVKSQQIHQFIIQSINYVW
jgi:hypothetical protein